MILKHIRIKNFRSIGEIDLELSPLTVLVGPNASGKSNILDALQFVRDVFREGLNAAVDTRQGVEYVRCQASNTSLGQLAEFIVTFVPHTPGWREHDAHITFLRYALTVDIPPRGSGTPGIIDELVTYSWAVDSTVEEVVRTPLRRADGKMDVFWDGASDLPEGIVGPAEDEDYLHVPTGDADRSAVPAFSLGSAALSILTGCVGRLDTYDIIPAVARQPSRTTADALDRCGGNLAAVLHSIANDPGGKRTLAPLREHLAAVVAGFADVVAEPLGDGYLTFRVVETGLSVDLRPDQVSDGTLRLLCYHALFASAESRSGGLSRVICVEEPERGLHPRLIAEIVEHFRSYAESGQVILTTHSPIVVDAVKPEEVVIVEKVDGTTRVHRASSREEVEIFLKRFTLGELWQQGRFGGVPS